jgi:hypothetical protein
VLIRALLSEFDADIRSAVRAKSRDLDTMREAVYNKLRAEYVRGAQAVIDDLHSETGLPNPKFDLTAKWKEAQLRDRANRMADSVYSTLDKETDRLRGLHKGTELASAVKKLKDEKVASLDAMASADGQFGALVDQLAQSGAVNAKKDRVMLFFGSPAPCPLCATITAGNPYTLEQCTNYGAKAHPNCRDHWERKQWDLTDSEKTVLRRRVKDGTLKTWAGGGKTPSKGSARDLAKVTAQAPEDFRAMRRYAIRQARKLGVPEETVDKLLNRKQLAARERRQAAKVRKGPRGGQAERLRMFESER